MTNGDFLLIILAVIIGITFLGIIIYNIVNSSWNEQRIWKNFVREYLHKEYNNLDSYTIYESEHQFGFGMWLRTGYKVFTCKAYNPRHALHRYFKHYKKKYNEIHDRSRKELIETSSDWGFLKVENNRTGFKRYFK
jgi:hypothetical protein